MNNKKAVDSMINSVHRFLLFIPNQTFYFTAAIALS